jgi:hypothetical protein
MAMVMTPMKSDSMTNEQIMMKSTQYTAASPGWAFGAMHRYIFGTPCANNSSFVPTTYMPAL